MNPVFEAHLAIAAVLLFIAFPVGLWFQRKERLERASKQGRLSYPRGGHVIMAITRWPWMVKRPTIQRMLGSNKPCAIIWLHWRLSWVEDSPRPEVDRTSPGLGQDAREDS